MAIRSEQSSHSCTTYLVLQLKGVVDHLKDKDGAERIQRASAALSAFTRDYTLTKFGYEIAKNERYETDVNGMVRKTIAAFIGKEERLKEVLKAVGGELYLEIVPYIRANCAQPNPILSLEEDVVGFLYKTGTRLDIDYYIV